MVLFYLLDTVQLVINNSSSTTGTTVVDNRIFLFCKNENGDTCSLIIHNTPRTVYFVPRIQPNFTDEGEMVEWQTNLFQSIQAFMMHTVNIIPSQISSVKLTQRTFPLDASCTSLSQPHVVVKVVYPRNLAILLSSTDINFEAYQFTHLFGQSTSALEEFLSIVQCKGKRKFSGWFSVNEEHLALSPRPITRVMQEFSVLSPTHIDVLGDDDDIRPPPTLKRMAIHSGVKYSVALDPPSHMFGEITGPLDGKRLNELVSYYDPDVICVHGPITPLMNRLNLSRMIGSKFSSLNGVTPIIGRLFVNTKNWAESSGDSQSKLDLSLKALFNAKPSPSPSPSPPSSSSTILPSTPPLSEGEMILGLEIHYNILQLSKKISQLTGQPWSQTLNNSKLAWVEWMIWSRFIETKSIPPSRKLQKQQPTSYVGGMVLEPEKGFHDTYTLLLDFRSLYPSIVVEFKICWSSDAVILPHLMRNLIELRKTLKQSPIMTQNILTESMALKLLANSCYGTLACPWSRFYTLPLAKMITECGRDVLTDTSRFILHRFPDTKILYGDTDSLFVDSGRHFHPQAVELAADIVDQVNKQFYYLELECEGYFRTFLLFMKKQYAGMLEDHSGKLTSVFKGHKSVKRDYAPFGAQLCKRAIMRIIGDRKKIPTVLLETYEDILATIESLPSLKSMELFTVTKKLQKRPKDYANPAGQYHVLAALDLPRQCEAGELIQFIMTEGRKPVALEQTHEGSFRLDYPWYFGQAYTMLSDVFSHFTEFDPKELAECLSVRSTISRKSIPLDASQSCPIDYFANRSSLTLLCNVCSKKTVHSGLENLEKAFITSSSSSSSSSFDDGAHQHWTFEKLQHTLGGNNFHQCSKCTTLHNFGKSIQNASEHILRSVMVQFDYRKILLHLDCLTCQQLIIQYLVQTGILPKFQNLIGIAQKKLYGVRKKI